MYHFHSCYMPSTELGKENWGPAKLHDLSKTICLPQSKSCPPKFPPLFLDHTSLRYKSKIRKAFSSLRSTLSHLTCWWPRQYLQYDMQNSLLLKYSFKAFLLRYINLQWVRKYIKYSLWRKRMQTQDQDEHICQPKGNS